MLQENIFGSAKKLGFGLMRLPLLNPDDATSIDVEQVKKMVDLFLSKGFTYFDTAIMYHAMKSQSAVKEFLVSRYPRDRFTLATKLHCGFFHSLEERDTRFQEQLQQTGVDYFDYYLLHDMSSDHYPIYTKFDCFNWLLQKKAQGLVRHIGFSYHDNATLLDKILTEHPEMEFVQLQLNYLDWESPSVQSRKCYEICEKHGKPVVVMEPVRGGTLANVPAAVAALFKECRPELSIPSWGIRFAASQPNVKIVLSGMSSLDQMTDNAGYMENFQPLNARESSIVRQAVEAIRASLAIPCTGCSYCTDGCPQKIAIPRYFALYNTEKMEENNGAIFHTQGMYYDRLSQVFGKAGSCLECGQCEAICPQHLPIIKYLKDVARQFE